MKNPATNNDSNPTYPHWYSPETGIYSSKHHSVPLPTDPFLDVVSFIFSHDHNGLTAIIDSSSGFSLSYSQLLPLVKSMASGLHNMGIRQGDVVLLLLPNSIYFPIVFFGVLYLGAIVTAMNPLSSVVEIKKQVVDCNPCFALGVSENFSKLQSLRIPVISVPENAALIEKNNGFEAFYGLLYSNIDELPLRPLIRQHETAVILYSSGTTGASRGVVLTHRNLISSVELFVRFEASQYEYSSSKNVYLAVLPMFHIYGLSLFVLGLLSLGSSIVVIGKFDVNEAVKVIDRYGVTHFPVVPPILTALTKSTKAVCGNGLKSLKQVSCGAAPLCGKTIHDFVEALPHVDFIQGYGMTESTAIGTRGFNTENSQKYSSIGLLAPNTQAKVVDWITGSFLPPGCSGELWIRGPGLMEGGYLNDRDATELAINKDGWLHTGDIVYVDWDGYFYLFDRLKELIKYKGFQIAPADLEAVLISHPEILDAAVTSCIDKECGEMPVAFVVKKDGSTLTQSAIINYVAQQVAPYKKVRKVIFTKFIPKSAAGKILRRELKSSLTSRL